eukprot:5559359-Prymnesium_polylepis.3
MVRKRRVAGYLGAGTATHLGATPILERIGERDIPEAAPQLKRWALPDRTHGRWLRSADRPQLLDRLRDECNRDRHGMRLCATGPRRKLSQWDVDRGKCGGGVQAERAHVSLAQLCTTRMRVGNKVCQSHRLARDREPISTHAVLIAIAWVG